METHRLIIIFKKRDHLETAQSKDSRSENARRYAEMVYVFDFDPFVTLNLR